MNRGTKINQAQHSSLGFIKNLLMAHWRSLLLLLIGVYLPLQIFQILAVKVWQNQGGFPWDVPTLLAVHSTAQPQLDVLAVMLTKLGSFWTALPILSAIAILLWRKRKWRSLAYLLTTAFGNLIINYTAKGLMHRVRPQLWESKAPEFDYAFPSGHAMTSMTLVVILLVLTWARPWRWLGFIFGSLFVLTVAWTRLYLGVHFPSDILAGWMVALAWSIGVSQIIKPNITKATPTNSEAQQQTSLLPEETQSH